MRKTHYLTADDWIVAGFRALSAGGAQAIKAEAIARDLKVSKGSFYWHFRDLAALKRAMLEHWAEVATFGTIENLAAAGAVPRDQLRQLVDIATNDRNAVYGGLLAEAAIRDWARFDGEVANVVRDAETARLGFLAALFERAGADAVSARRYGRTLYGALIGLQHLTHQGMANLGPDLAVLLALLLGEIDGRGQFGSD